MQLWLGEVLKGIHGYLNRYLHYLKTGELIPGPTAKEKIDTIIRHLDMLVELKGEHIGVCEMRKHIAWYIKGMPNSASIKEKVFRLSDKNEIIALLNEFIS